MDRANSVEQDRKPKVLIVDDVASNIKILGNILRNRKIEVSFATNGTNALKIAQSVVPDLILLDISMPELDGYEVCKQLKEKSLTSEIPIIFLTARIEATDIIKGFNVGAVDYITKPFHSQELLSRIQTHLELKMNREKLKNLNTILEEKVKQRTVQLTETNEKLRESNRELSLANKKLSVLDRAKNDFLHLINHELRTPLNSIQGFFGILKDDKQCRHNNLIEPISMAIEKLNHLSQTILFIMSLRAEKYQKEFFPVNLHALVREVNDTLAPKLQAKNLQLVIKNNLPEQVKVVTDRRLLNKALKIILANSIHHSPENQVIEVDINSNDAAFHISITDYGKGFSKAILEQPFLLFASSDVEHHSTGYGLGLSTARLIMNTLSGDITLSNTKKAGAQVTLIITQPDESNRPTQMD